MSLSPRERVKAQVNHQDTDILPYTLSFEEDVARRLDKYYGDPSWRYLIDEAIVFLPLPSEGLIWGDLTETVYVDLYGTQWRVDQRIPHVNKPALQQPTLDNFTFPEVDAVFKLGWKDQALQVIEQRKDYFLIGYLGMGVFERSWALRGFEEALVDAIAHPSFYDELVEQITFHQLAIIERLLDLPIDGILFTDDWGYQQGVILGPERWRRYLKPRLARLFSRVHDAGKHVLAHCCGSIVDILPDLIEIGLEVYESVQPEAKNNNPYELKSRHGNRLTFWGGLGSQSIIPFGTPQEIHREVRKLCQEMGRGGGYILAPAKEIQIDTPTENAAAVLEAFLNQTGVKFP